MIVNNNSYEIAEFAFNTPLKRIPKAILVLVDGSNTDGRWMVKSLTWRKFATVNNLMLVGCYFRDKFPHSIEEYCKASQGTGDELIKAVDKELISLGWDPSSPRPKFLMWGFSAGGQFNFEFTCWRPDLVRAFVVNKGGVYYSALASKEAREVPGLFFIGAFDDDWRKDILRGIVELNKRFGADWNHYYEYVGHDIGQSIEVSKDFFKKYL